MQMYAVKEGKLVEVEGGGHKEHYCHKAKEALHRIEEEFHGWGEYHELRKHNSEESEKYSIAAHQEFGHLLMAADDFFTHMLGILDETERAEMLKWVSTVINKVNK